MIVSLSLHTVAILQKYIHILTNRIIHNIPNERNMRRLVSNVYGKKKLVQVGEFTELGTNLNQKFFCSNQPADYWSISKDDTQPKSDNVLSLIMSS